MVLLAEALSLFDPFSSGRCPISSSPPKVLDGSRLLPTEKGGAAVNMAAPEIFISQPKAAKPRASDEAQSPGELLLKSNSHISSLSVLVSFLFVFLSGPSLLAAPKNHSVTLGRSRNVPYVPMRAAAVAPSDGKSGESTLGVRALYVDGRQKEWTTGEMHNVTDRTFTIRRALRLNDALPTDTAAHWVWQPGPWLMVNRTTGHITALHLPDFDPAVSEVAWFRDYAAYCGVGGTAKGGLFAVVAQLGSRRAVVRKRIGKWPQAAYVISACQPAQWQRQPMRVTIQPTGGDATTYDVLGSASLVEESDDAGAN